MKLYFKIAVLKLVFGLFFFSGLRASSLDTLNRDGLHNLVDNYYELFGLSDLDGHYHVTNESRFKSLFLDNATIVNFLPGTSHYEREITPEQYINELKGTYNGRIIRPGKPLQYQVKEQIYKISEGYIKYVVELKKSVAVFDRDTYQEIDIFPTTLLLDIFFLVEEQEYKIKAIRVPGMRYYNLKFRVLYPDRQIARNLPVLFSYEGPAENLIARKRYSNQRGEVFISNVPENASLRIYTDEGVMMDSGIKKTAAEWFALRQEDRFLLTDGSAFHARRPAKFRLEGGVFFPLQMLTSDISFKGDSSVNKNLMTSVTPLPGGYIYLSRIIFHHRNLNLSLSSGIERFAIGFKSLIPSEIYISSTGMEQSAEDSERDVIGWITNEEYLIGSIRIPLSLTLSFCASDRFFGGVDIRALARYVLPCNHEYKIYFRSGGDADVVKTTSDDVGGFLFDNSTNWVQSGNISYLAGKVREPEKWLMGIEAIFNFNLYSDFVTFQYRISYNLNTIGTQGEPHYYKLRSEGQRFQYQPFLSGNQLRYMNLAVGFGFAFNF